VPVTWLLHLDAMTLLWINQFAQHSHALDHILVILIGQEVLQGSYFFVFLWWLWFRQPDAPFDDRVDVLRIIATICIADLLARILQQNLPMRLRPINDPAPPFVLPYTEWPSALEHWSLFPSDHAIIYYALATAIWVRHRLMGALAFIWITVFCALARVYTGMRYPLTWHSASFADIQRTPSYAYLYSRFSFTPLHLHPSAAVIKVWEQIGGSVDGAPAARPIDDGVHQRSDPREVAQAGYAR
jgi:hypothetical protein